MKKWNAARAKKQLDKLWSQIIHQRDQVCQFCGRDHGVMNAHHAQSRRHLATRWNPANGILLCFACHNRAHNDIPWGSREAERVIGTALYNELYDSAHKIVPFDKVVWAVKLVELKKLL
jgi:5-methylcytosine-specific restriction endonuclease McrA